MERDERMSFTREVKEDLTRSISGEACCRQAEFIAFFLINGNIRIGNGISLTMQTENSAVARKIFTLAKDFSLEREISIYRRKRLRKNQVYTITIPAQPQLQVFFSELGMVDEHGGWRFGVSPQIRSRFLKKTCCRRAYLRGAFLASGSVADPAGASYHLELDALDPSQARLIVSLLTEYGVIAKTIGRKGRETVYLKGAEPISDFLNIIGSYRSLLALESVRVKKGIRNQANRMCNCDTANINKTVAAAVRQAEEIGYISRKLGLGNLPRNLRMAAELRLDNPDASLAELAELSSLGRSALNHRFRRLSRIAENIRNFGAEEWDRD